MGWVSCSMDQCTSSHLDPKPLWWSQILLLHATSCERTLLDMTRSWITLRYCRVFLKKMLNLQWQRSGNLWSSHFPLPLSVSGLEHPAVQRTRQRSLLWEFYWSLSRKSFRFWFDILRRYFVLSLTGSISWHSGTNHGQGTHSCWSWNLESTKARSASSTKPVIS